VAGIAQSVQRLASSWKVRVSNPVRVIFSFAPLQTGPGTHPVSLTMGTGSFPVVKCSRWRTEVEERLEIHPSSTRGHVCHVIVFFIRGTSPVLAWRSTPLVHVRTCMITRAVSDGFYMSTYQGGYLLNSVNLLAPELFFVNFSTPCI